MTRFERLKMRATPITRLFEPPCRFSADDVAAALDTLSSLTTIRMPIGFARSCFSANVNHSRRKQRLKRPFLGTLLVLVTSNRRDSTVPRRHLSSRSSERIPEWLEPVSPMFVRQDDESVAARRSAATEFEQLSGPEFEHSADDLACIQAWRVGCLADNADSRGDAAELARAILDADPSNYRVMVWVLGRDLEVTIDLSIAALEEKVRHETANVEEIASPGSDFHERRPVR